MESESRGRRIARLLLFKAAIIAAAAIFLNIL